MKTTLVQRAAELALNPVLLLDVVAPVVGYRVLTGRGVSTVSALAAASLFPVAGIVVSAVRSRRMDPIGLLALAAIAVGLFAGLVLHEGRILLVKDSLMTGTLGIIFLGSLLAPRPMVFTLQQRLTRKRQAGPQSHDRSWRDPRVRVWARRSTALWGVALSAEAAVRIGLSYAVTPGTLVVISPLLATATFGPLALWTMRQGRRLPGGAQGSGQASSAAAASPVGYETTERA